MGRHFSSEQLYHLRNNISIDALIKALGISYRQCPGELFRFQCPRCLGYHTSTHPQTNLARCFTCQTNFNSIELVMLVKKLPFVASVYLLQQHECTLGTITHALAPQKPHRTSTATSTPTSIGELLRRIAGAVKEPS